MHTAERNIPRVDLHIGENAVQSRDQAQKMRFREKLREWR
jgi:hypothetical protein